MILKRAEMVSDEFFMRVMVNQTRSASLLGRTFNGFAKKFNSLCLQVFFFSCNGQGTIGDKLTKWKCNVLVPSSINRQNSTARYHGNKLYRLKWVTPGIILVEYPELTHREIKSTLCDTELVHNRGLHFKQTPAAVLDCQRGSIYPGTAVVFTNNGSEWLGLP